MKRKRVPPNMAAQVLLTFGSDCWLDMPGCTHRGTETMDHVKPYSLYGPTVPSNLRPACKHCNSLRADRVVSGFGAQVTAVIGPPCVGKTAYVRDHMAPGDIVVDPSRLAGAGVGGGSRSPRSTRRARSRRSARVSSSGACAADVPQQSEHAGRVDRVEL